MIINRFNEEYPSYCNYNGEIRRQKTVDYQGNWAKCQNNYECESNICSSGECIEVTKMLDQVKGLKGFFVKLVCKISNFFDVENYESCVMDVFGGEIEKENISSSSSGGGGSGSGSSNLPA
jgi:hypothetical protein